MRYNDATGDFSGSWPESNAQRERRRRVWWRVRRFVSVLVLGGSVLVLAALAVRFRWDKPVCQGGQTAVCWLRGASARVGEWFATKKNSTELEGNIDSLIAEVREPDDSGEYEERYQVYVSDLDESVNSRKSKREIARIREKDRGQAVGTLRRLQAIVLDSKSLPEKGGTAFDLQKLNALSERLEDYKAYRHELATGRSGTSGASSESFSVKVEWLMRDSGGVVFLVFLAVCAVCYIKAYPLVTTGRMTVYADWQDFGASVVWALLLPFGYGALVADDLCWIWRFVGLASLAGGAWSAWQMVARAFRYNTTRRLGWIALGARLAVALLALFAVAKLSEKLQAYKRRELGVIRGVLIPLAVFTAVFNWLIRPMIGSERWRW